MGLVWGLLGVIGGLVALVVLAHLFCYFFIGRPLKNLVAPWLRDSDKVTVKRGKWLVFEPRGQAPKSGPTTGIIFHPGGYVDPEAYARIFHKVAEAGVRCVLVPGPQRTPIANRFSSDKVIEAQPDIQRWFIAGHSQGGAVATLYMRDRLDLPEYREKIAGLIYLGCFVFDRHSLAARDLPCLSIYGDRDGHADKFEPNEKNLPQDARVVCIEGGNHGQFGAYGMHFPDGTPAVSRDVQQDRAISEITEFLRDHD